jgi:hypothetical protein
MQNQPFSTSQSVSISKILHSKHFDYSPLLQFLFLFFTTPHKSLSNTVNPKHKATFPQSIQTERNGGTKLAGALSGLVIPFWLEFCGGYLAIFVHANLFEFVSFLSYGKLVDLAGPAFLV